jgi:chromosome segregation ATPase
MPKKVVVDFELKYKEAAKNLDDFQKEYAKLEKQVVDANKKTAESVKDVGKSAEKSSGKLKKVGSALGGLAKFTGVLFILQKAFEFISEAVQSNQTVMDSLRVGFETAQIVFNQVADAIFKNSENFDALGRIMGNLLTLALTPIKLSFYAIKAAVLGAQLAWEQSWLGGGDEEKIADLKSQLSEVKDDVIDIGKSAIEAGGNIVNDFGEAVTEISNIANEVTKAVSAESIKAASDTAKANIALKKSADLARVANQGLIEDYDRQAEQQRQIRDNDLNSIQDRITANETLKEKLTEQKDLMLENAQAILAAAEAQYSLTGADEDNLAVQEAKNELKAVEAQIEGFMSEQKSNSIALQKEEMELQQSIDEGDAMRRQSERAFNAEMELSEATRMQMLLDNLIIEEEAESRRLKAKRDSYKAGTQAYIDANNELLDYQQANAQEQDKIETQLTEKKQELMSNALGNMATIVGKNSKFGKAIAIVQAIRDTFAGANKALASAPPPFNFIQAAAVIAGGIANVKNITSSKEPTAPSFAKGGTGGEQAVSVPSAPPPVIPDINTVASSGINQLADAIGDQSQQPIQAYVVSNDVTTAQSLERNIVDGAAIG